VKSSKNPVDRYFSTMMVAMMVAMTVAMMVATAMTINNYREKADVLKI
jgi:hypothetical protein